MQIRHRPKAAVQIIFDCRTTASLKQPFMDIAAIGGNEPKLDI